MECWSVRGRSPFWVVNAGTVRVSYAKPFVRGFGALPNRSQEINGRRVAEKTAAVDVNDKIRPEAFLHEISNRSATKVPRQAIRLPDACFRLILCCRCRDRIDDRNFSPSRTVRPMAGTEVRLSQSAA
jgi:hypothetical protein